MPPKSSSAHKRGFRKATESQCAAAIAKSWPGRKRLVPEGVAWKASPFSGSFLHCLLPGCPDMSSFPSQTLLPPLPGVQLTDCGLKTYKLWAKIPLSPPLCCECEILCLRDQKVTKMDHLKTQLSAQPNTALVLMISSDYSRHASRDIWTICFSLFSDPVVLTWLHSTSSRKHRKQWAHPRQRTAPQATHCTQTTDCTPGGTKNTGHTPKSQTAPQEAWKTLEEPPNHRLHSQPRGTSCRVVGLSPCSNWLPTWPCCPEVQRECGALVPTPDLQKQNLLNKISRRLWTYQFEKHHIPTGQIT